MPTLEYENKYPGQLVCGLDEVGRGSLAGPLVTAGVILPRDAHLPNVTDSKKIPKTQHEALVRQILDQAIEVRVDIQSAEQVDTLSINPAIKHSMAQVVRQFQHRPEVLLIDGAKWQKLDVKEIGFSCIQETIVKGDNHSLSIACASLVAKYIHDRWMFRYHQQYPEYHFHTNTGYGTKHHLQAIQTYGVTPIHRKTYQPIKSWLEAQTVNERR